MRNGGKQVRLRLFEMLSADLAKYMVGRRDVVWCPLCMKEFGRDAAESGLMTEEHVIPESTGNVEVTLTCKPCNDRAGHQIDHHIARKVRHDLAFLGGEPIKGRLKWDGGGSPVNMSINKEGDLHLDVTRANPHVTKSFVDRLRAHATGERPIQFRLTNPYHVKKFAAALVKAAYLGLFVDRKYGYALLPSLDPIRRAILEDSPERDRLHEIVVPCNVNSWDELPQAPDRITFETHGLGSVPVCLSYINLRNLSGGALVVLPPQVSLNTGSFDGLARATEALRQKTTFEVEMTNGGKLILGFDPG